MANTSISPCAVTDIENAPNIAALTYEYVRESGIPGMPFAGIRWDIYHKLEAAGLLHIFAAHDAGELVGFYAFTVSPMPNYGVPVAATSVFFVAKSHREGGAGLRLLKAGEDAARAMGAVGLLVGAPVGGRLAEVLPRRGYAEADRMFFKVL